MNKKETMLEAFLRQTKINDKEASLRDQTSKDLGDYLLTKAMNGQASMPNIRETINVPTQLHTNPLVDSKTPKRGEKGYTEINRWKMLGGKTVTEDGVDDGEIEMGDMGSEDV